MRGCWGGGAARFRKNSLSTSEEIPFWTDRSSRCQDFFDLTGWRHVSNPLLNSPALFSLLSPHPPSLLPFQVLWDRGRSERGACCACCFWRVCSFLLMFIWLGQLVSSCGLFAFSSGWWVGAKVVNESLVCTSVRFYGCQLSLAFSLAVPVTRKVVRVSHLLMFQMPFLETARTVAKHSVVGKANASDTV